MSGLTHVVGIDPGSTMLGISAFRLTGSSAELVGLASVRVGDDLLTGTRVGVRNVLADWAVPWQSPTCGWSVEHAPPTAHADVGHGAQAVIGWGLAASAYTVLGAFCHGPHRVILPTPWREKMLITGARHRLLIEKPSRKVAAPPRPVKVNNVLGPVKRDGDAWVSTYRGCGHPVRIVGDYQVLTTTTIPPCPVCAAPPTETTRTGDQVRDLWKAAACRFVGHLWPEHYAAVVRDARSRARTNPPDHHLVGVSDACEAVGIGVAGVIDLVGDRTTFDR